jgi:hypothetical protein
MESKMQTSKIKVDGVYAYKRGVEFVRFVVDTIVTRKDTSKTESVIEGHIVEDGGTRNTLKLGPDQLEGPYEQVAELVERKAKEDAERKAKADEDEARHQRDRLTLYRFIGVKPPKNAKDYDQFFRCSYGSVDIRSEGVRALVDHIEKLEQDNKAK